MHQEHNIPWNKVASHLQFIRENKHVTPHQTNFFPRQRPSQANDLNHFARVVASSVSTFAETERAKFPSARELEKRAGRFTSGKLFSDEIRDRHPDYLNSKNQLVEHWIDRAKDVGTDVEIGRTTTTYAYDTRHGDLADVVKVLIDEGEMETLLLLAHHPQVPIGQLSHLHWGHHFGFSRVAESAIASYIFFNVIAAANFTHAYRELDAYRSLMQLITPAMDYEAQQEPHWRVFGRGRSVQEVIQDVDIFADTARAKEYMKELFRLSYRYELLVREPVGLDSRLDHWVVWAMNWLFSVKIEHELEGESSQYRLVFA